MNRASGWARDKWWLGESKEDKRGGGALGRHDFAGAKLSGRLPGANGGDKRDSPDNGGEDPV